MYHNFAYLFSKWSEGKKLFSVKSTELKVLAVL